jgi:hypothetical protein
MVITAPEPLRSQPRTLSSAQLVAAAARLRPDLSNLADPVQAAQHALRSIALRVQHLNVEIRSLRTQLDELTRFAAPAASAVSGLGRDTVAALLIAVDDNPDRLGSEAAFAHLCGVAPIPASSGKTNRHRLHRGGDRVANSAAHRRGRPTTLRPAQPGLRRPPHCRRHVHARNHPLPEALPRPRSLSGAALRLRRTQHLTSIDIYRSVRRDLLEHVNVEDLVGDQPLEPGVLSLEVFEPLGVVGFHAAVLSEAAMPRRLSDLEGSAEPR